MTIPAKMVDGSPVSNVYCSGERVKTKNNRRSERVGAVAGKGKKLRANPNKKHWHKRRTSKLDSNGNIVAIEKNLTGPKGKRSRRSKLSVSRAAAS